MSKKYFTYTSVEPTVGVFQRNYYAYNNFASFKGSSYLSNDYNNETVVIEPNNNKLYHSDLQNNANFTITFKNHRLKLSGFTLLSCLTSGCVYNIEVFGSNDGVLWNYECPVSKSTNYFMSTAKYTDCQSKSIYKYYRLMHKGLGSSDQAYFPIYYLELFGDLYPNHNLFYVSKSCKGQSISNIFFFIFLCAS